MATRSLSASRIGGWVLAGGLLFGVASCAKFFDTTIYSRDPYTGACPDPVQDGAAPGEECETAEDCAEVCCDCAINDRPSYGAAACIDHVCASADEVCSYVLENQPKACAPMVLGNQEDGACPSTEQDGKSPGKECEAAEDCKGECCTCPDGVTTYEASSCQIDLVETGKQLCQEPEVACQDALDANPALCPAATP
ncbi:MAG: hypothetical protein U0271_44030 [Polyangiaceae bacterium]